MPRLPEEWLAELQDAARANPLTFVLGDLDSMVIGICLRLLVRTEEVGFAQAVREMRECARAQREHSAQQGTRL